MFWKVKQEAQMDFLSGTFFYDTLSWSEVSLIQDCDNTETKKT